MSRICQSCGGIIGRDCFNPQECDWITQSMEHQEYLDRQAKSEPASTHPEEPEGQEEKKWTESEVEALVEYLVPGMNSMVLISDFREIARKK